MNTKTNINSISKANSYFGVNMRCAKYLNTHERTTDSRTTVCVCVCVHCILGEIESRNLYPEYLCPYNKVQYTSIRFKIYLILVY